MSWEYRRYSAAKGYSLVRLIQVKVLQYLKIEDSN